jgi:hypothetical protein
MATTPTHNILLTDEACFLRDGVFNVHSSHLWAWHNPRNIGESEYQVGFNINVFAEIVG